jgi:hypothetical protein
MRRPHSANTSRAIFTDCFHALHPPVTSLINTKYVPVIVLLFYSGARERFSEAVDNQGLFPATFGRTGASPFFLSVMGMKVTLERMPRPHNASRRPTERDLL